jgi:hypothetical protein
MELTELNIETTLKQNVDKPQTVQVEILKVMECYDTYINTFLETGVHKSNTIFKYNEMDNLFDNYIKTKKSIVGDDGLFKTHLMLTTEDKKLFEDNLIEATIELRPEKAYELIMKLLNDNYNGNPPCELEDEYIIPYKHGTLALINCKTVPYDSNQIKARIDTVAVVLGDKVETIPARAFTQCVNIEHVVMMDSVTDIGNVAFNECSSLESIVLSRSLKILPYSLFYKCVNLRTIVIPESVDSIYKDAFNGCTKIQTVVLPKKLVKLDMGVFAECVNLEKIIMPISLESLSTGTFFNCRNLKTIVFPENLKSIGFNCFESCYCLDISKFPDSVTYIGVNAFANCANIKSIVLPPIRNIEGSTFFCCKRLKSVTIPSSVEGIGDYAFSQCPSLDSIFIPKTVKHVGHVACSDPTDDIFLHNYTSVIYENLFNSTSRFSASYIKGLTKHTLKNVKFPLIYGNGK